MSKPTMHEPSAEVRAALAPLMRAVADFALAASRQFGELDFDAYAALAADHKAGLVEPVVVVSINPTNPCAQFCMDVGTERRVIISVPMGEGVPPAASIN